MKTYDLEPDNENDTDDVQEDSTEAIPVEVEEIQPEPTPEPELPPPLVAEPPPAPVVDATPVNELLYKAFCEGIDAAVKMYGGLCNIGHKRQMAIRAGYEPPEE